MEAKNMTPQEVIEQTRLYAGEYLEMSTNPDAMLSQILATRISSLMEYVEHLKRCVYYETR